MQSKIHFFSQKRGSLQFPKSRNLKNYITCHIDAIFNAYMFRIK